LILTGYTGLNQTRVGGQVAERLKMRYVNVELQFETRAGMRMEEVRRRYGEARLKTMEAEVMQEMLLHRGTVIHIGGATLERGDTLKRPQESGTVICLVVALDAALHRLHLSLGRNYHNPHERALAIGNLKREWAVRKSDSVHELDATYFTEDETVEAVIDLWQKMNLLRYEQRL
jgi:shikimate kinase